MWLITSFIGAVTNFILVGVTKGMMPLLVIFIILNGIPLGARFLNETILADIIEYEELITDRRAEAEFTMF